MHHRNAELILSNKPIGYQSDEGVSDFPSQFGFEFSPDLQAINVFVQPIVAELPYQTNKQFHQSEQNVRYDPVQHSDANLSVASIVQASQTASVTPIGIGSQEFGDVPPPSQGTESFFTDGLDTLYGSTSGTTFIGDDSTVQSFDRIIGGDGFNVANLTLGNGGISSGPLSIFASNIDRINVVIDPDSTVLISGKGWTQVDEFWVSGSLGNSSFVNLLDLHESMTFGFDEFSGSVANTYADMQSLGSASSLNLVLLNGSAVKATINAPEFHQLDVTSSGSAPNQLILELPDQSNGHGLDSLFVSGDEPLALSASGGEFGQLTYIDARNLSGGLHIDLETSMPFEFSGGNGADFLNVMAGSAGWLHIDGGDGVDSLEIGAASQLVMAGGVSNFEALLLSGTLDAGRTISNSAGFHSIELLDRTTDYGRDLTLNGFSDVIIDDDQNATVRLLNGSGTELSNSVSIKFASGADIFGRLDLSALNHADLTTDDQGVVTINTLTLALTVSFEENSISFGGSGNFRVGSVHGGASLVDLSGLHGSWVAGDAFGFGTNYVVGDLSGTSVIWLGSESNGRSANSEVLFGAGPSPSGLEGTVQLHNFDLINPGGSNNHDLLDLGRLGVTTLSELSIAVSNGDTYLSSLSHSFEGVIQLVGVDLLNAIGGPAAYIEFDGVLK